MNAYLLYPDREWSNAGHYYDEKAIIQDLGLNTLFRAAAREIQKDGDKIVRLGEPVPFLESTMKKVMMVPLETEEEILYRQDILKDCLAREDFIRELYAFSAQILTDWDKLGRKAGGKLGTRNSPRALIAEIHVLQLFVKSLSGLKALFAKYGEAIRSEGLRSLRERLDREFSDELEADLGRILEGIAFYANDKESGPQILLGHTVNKPRIVIGCNIGDGLKLNAFRLEEVETDVRRYRNPGSMLSRARKFWNEKTKPLFYVQNETELAAQAQELEYQAVRYIVSRCDSFYNAFNGFFGQLHTQAAFYLGVVNLRHHMERFKIACCYPRVTAGDVLRFRELKEFVMGLEQHLDPVGNTCDIRGKMLLIVTGANQGGKSTFLRSIGIAQIMMQCGLPVTALEYESGIFPVFFTHFTRREDSAMNSGRLDEELGRMSRIVDNLGERSMVLLNESFASTTEKDGSVIAYDIIRAMKEYGVKVLTVTHLLSFAQRVYEESADAPDSGVEFLSAQRKADGERTYKMIQHAPELTSFGLDLYDEIIGQEKKD